MLRFKVREQLTGEQQSTKLSKVLCWEWALRSKTPGALCWELKLWASKLEGVLGHWPQRRS